MAIAFFHPISEDFYKKLYNSRDLDEKIDAFIKNIHECLSIIQTFYGIRKCNLERYQIRLFFEGLESYSKNLRRSNRFLRKDFIDFCQKYPLGFIDCVPVVESRCFLILPRSNNSSSK